MTKTIAILLLGTLGCVAADKKNSVQRFGDADMPLIRTKVRFTTLILLPEGEEISEVVCGDKEYWVIEGKDSIVYVKPAKEGVSTNINIVSKNKTVYSFLVQEISKPGSKEKPDLKVVLGGDETTKLRKDKENLEELLMRSEKSVKELTDKVESEKSKKKGDVELPEALPLKAEPPAELTPPDRIVPPTAAPPPPTPSEPASNPAVQVAAGSSLSEAGPTFGTVVVDRPDGLIRKTGRFLGKLFARVGQKLRIY